jgi:nucleotide-binding universal stress UspA family protein
MSISQVNKTIANQNIVPFQVKQAMVALELGEEDNKLLNYLDFFSSLIPIQQTHFLHVLPSFDAFNNILKEEGSALISNFEVNEEVLLQMKEEVRVLIDKKEIGAYTLDVREGNPLEELLKDAKEVVPDLVFIGQQSNVGEHGILAKNLARRTKSNALVVPEKAKKTIKNILVPVDFSSYSAKALETAAALRAQIGETVQITCVHIYKMPDLSVYRVQKTFQQFQKMVEGDRLEALNAFISAHAPEYAEEIKRKLIHQAEPGIAHYLLQYAQEIDTGLVIMGAKGYSKVELLLLGSVTEKLLTLNDKFPTLVVK